MDSATSSGRDLAFGPDPLRIELSELDERLLELISWLRVVDQTQLERLYPEVPGRSLRYRTRRLHGLGLIGRTRPYRDRGSAPHHLWPTGRGDALVRGKPRPRRGERAAPNPLFLAHSASLSELYVVLSGAGPDLELSDFRREGEAREAFVDRDGRRRAIAPDVRVELCDPGGRRLVANVELDLGTMSHGRLRTKLEGYLAHASQKEDPLPLLLFVTTSERRGEEFLRAWRRLRDDADRFPGAERLALVACDRARRLDTTTWASCWQTADQSGLVLTDLPWGTSGGL